MLHSRPEHVLGTEWHLLLLLLLLTSTVVSLLVKTVPWITPVLELLLHSVLKIGVHRHHVLVVRIKVRLLRRHLHHLSLLGIHYITQLQALGRHDVYWRRLHHRIRGLDCRVGQVCRLLYRWGTLQKLSTDTKRI